MTTSTTTPPPAAGHKVMMIIEENHSRTEAMANMPHLAAWASQYGQATNYTATTHPSLPNYLAIGGGSTFGVTDDNPPSSHSISGASVFGQTLAAGKTAKVYAETMPTNCALTNSGTYAVKHNEWAYFSDATERSGCNTNDVSMGTTATGNLLNDVKAGQLPVTGQMTPNLCNDAHDCSLATADTWLDGWIPKLMAGPDYTSGNLTIVVTFDEDDSSAANNVAFVVIDPRLAGKTVATAANHYSLTRWLDTNAGTALLHNAATAADLKSAFGL
jgi:acid phosphatase